MSAAAAYKFLPWLREGAATLITTPDDLATAAASFQMQAEVMFTSGQARTAIHLFGPGDMVGLAKGAVSRREPAPGSTGFEPNYFPLVEFREPDLPWRFTPTRAARQDQLRPWLALIAVEQAGGVTVQQAGEAPLPAIAVPRNQLPDPAELDRWAHVQVAGPFPSPDMNPDQVAAYVRANPGRALARILCPRRLRPNSSYIVCLVPVFEIGRRAGLGQEFDANALKLQFAWDFSEEGTDFVTLPVYDSWAVTTGPARDTREEFEQLARALRPYSIPAESATLPLVVDAPLTSAPPLVMRFAGALRPVGTSGPPPAPAEVRTNLADWINSAADAEDTGGDPQVAPPLYGRWQAGVRRAAVTPSWLSELNHDPRMRAAAAAGGDIVQRHQDEFIAEAWRQAGQLRQANQLLKGAQVARSANEALIRKHLEPLPADLLLQVAGPDRARIRFGDSTLYQAVDTSAVPHSGVEGTFRRVARAQGPHMRSWNVAQPAEEESAYLFRQGYVRTPPTTWSAFDEGNVNAPSSWVRNDAAPGTPITQTSNIHSLPLEASSVPKLGTMYVTGNTTWRDVLFGVSIRSDDNDAVGLVFRFTGISSYYRFSMDSERSYRRLVKRQGNTWRVMWQDGFKYTVGATYRIQVQVEGNQIRIFFNGSKIVDLTDQNSPLSVGRVGLYTWGNHFTRFSDFTIDVQQGLDRGEMTSALVVDQGNLEGPSNWTTESGDLKQTRNIYSGPKDRDDLPKLGTYVKAVPDALIPSWTDYHVKVHLEAQDDDALGLMFRYNGPDNFYRFSMDRERSYQRLVKCVNGQYTLLWQRDEGFELNEMYRLEITADGSRLRGYLDRRKLFDVRDRSHPRGTVAFYCWGLAGAIFRYAEVKRIRREGIMARLNAGQLGVPVPPSGRLSLNTMKSALLNSLAPNSLVHQRAMERLRLPTRAAFAQGDPLAPIAKAPEIRTPLSTRLIEQAPALMLPGVNDIPENAVSALETNPAFVAALLVGANHEMTRELLWRGPDTDLRATVFRQFWDLRGAAGGAQEDIPPIHTWNAVQGLAAQVTTAQGQSRSVFLVRSELLRRFPDARYYLVQAVSNGAGGRKPGSTVSLPQFRGRFGDDIAFFGFAQTPGEVSGESGGLGWYFVIEQRPDAGRFGLLIEGPDAPADWTEIGWNHVDGAAYARATPLSAVPPNGGPVWGRNAAHMAAITQRKPFRLLIHAGRLLIPES